MSNVELLASDVVIVEEEPQFSALPDIPTAILGGVGITERGPFGATLTNSYPEWLEYYGGLTANSDLTMAAMGFYLNGGQTFWGARTVHHTDITDASTRTSAAATAAITTTGAATQGSVTSGNAEPFYLTPGGTLDLSVDGGGTETATFDAGAATVSGSGGSYPTGYSGGETLVLKIDDGPEQTVTFSAGAQSLAQVIDEINPAVSGCYADEDTGELRLTSDKKGTDSKIEIMASSTGLTELGLSSGTSNGSGDVANIAAVTAAEAKTRIEDDTTAQVTIESTGEITIKTPTVGDTGSIQVEATSTLDGSDYFDLDNSVHDGTPAGAGTMGNVNAKYHGAYGNTLVAQVADASSGDSDQFNLYITESGVVLEVFPNLSTVTTNERYWETIVNTRGIGSELVEVEDLLAGTPPDNRPTNGSYSLAGGSDGLTSLDDNDFIGSEAGGTGMYALDAVENLTLLIVPGRATSAVHNAMLSYCETHRSGQVFCILDCPAGMTAAEIVTYVKTTAAIQQFSEFGAIYWPRICILNPDTSVFTSDANGNITVAPSGWIAGVYARTDGSSEGGIYQPPAGVERGILYSVLGFETDEVLDIAKRKLVYPELINPLTTWDGAPRHIDGTRTLKSTGNFPTIAERRGVSNIERTIRLGLSFARHSNNTRQLRRRCHRTVTLYLIGEMGKGAFASDDPATAFFVDFSDALNPPSVVQARKLKGRIGLATNKPVDWVVINIAQDTRAIDEQLASV